MSGQIPETLWQVFCRRWMPVANAPADAADWLARGYLLLVLQGKALGYSIALPGYRRIVGG